MISYRQADLLERLRQKNTFGGEVYLRRNVDKHGESWLVQPITWEAPEPVKDRVTQALAQSGAQDIGHLGYGFDVSDHDEQAASIFDFYDDLKDNMMDQGLNLLKHSLNDSDMIIKYETLI